MGRRRKFNIKRFVPHIKIKKRDCAVDAAGIGGGLLSGEIAREALSSSVRNNFVGKNASEITHALKCTGVNSGGTGMVDGIVSTVNNPAGIVIGATVIGGVACAAVAATIYDQYASKKKKRHKHRKHHNHTRTDTDKNKENDKSDEK